MNPVFCRHWECTIDRVMEMVLVSQVIAPRLPGLANRMLALAADLLHEQHIDVRCRHVPRPSFNGQAPLAPLPPRRAP